MVDRYKPELGEDCTINLVLVNDFDFEGEELVKLEDYFNDVDQREEQIWNLNDEIQDMVFELRKKDDEIRMLEAERDALLAQLVNPV